ncbi:hypothetical protein [Streptomyces sp. NRRL S-1868]|uniref:hypothetical protein n=1 Tax=Streptomyces sp. NRRL S-1868 TaxID=1463892 RepID=UPI00131E4085|nr:hypothetical protein [Streptomyces sp. NRRL S-1868]
MDQGVAALIAGLAGMAGALGGAVAGAIGAVRGARVGAEKTAEATRQQVRDQAKAEHGHWLRQQRQAAYSAFIVATQGVERAADAVLRSTPSPRWRDEVESLVQRMEELNDVASQVSVLGPESMIAKTKQVGRGILRLRAALNGGGDAIDFTQEHQDRIDECWDDFVEAGQLFQEGARQVLISQDQ